MIIKYGKTKQKSYLEDYVSKRGILYMYTERALKETVGDMKVNNIATYVFQSYGLINSCIIYK